MKKKILFTIDALTEEMRASLKELGYELYFEKEGSFDFQDYMKEIEVVVGLNPFKNLDITRFSSLRLVQLSTAGIDQISAEQMSYIADNEIILANHKGGYGIPIGEWIVMNILQLSRNTRQFHENQREGQWKLLLDIDEVYGKTVTILGTGNIAIEAAKRLKAFEVKLIGVNTDGRAVEYFDNCYSIKDMNKALAQGDYVVVTLPNTDDTNHLLNETALAAMKKGSYLVNISRGRVIDEEALIKFLDSGHIKAAALDVFTQEPLPKSSRLWSLDNVILTPHNSWTSNNSISRRDALLYKNLKAYSEGRQLLNVIDFKKGY